MFFKSILKHMKNNGGEKIVYKKIHLKFVIYEP